MKDVNLLVVLSREVDDFGTFAADLYPQGIFEMVQQVADGIHYLKDRGFERFVVITDHGFLFLPPGVQPRILEAPAAKVTRRRFAIGGTGEGCLVKRAEEIGLQGTEVLAFPMGLAVFGLKGEVGAFQHGGLSLQECIVPAMEVKVLAPVEKVPVTMELGSSLTSRLAVVTVRVREGQPILFAQPRRVQVEINGRRGRSVDLSVDYRQETMQVVWLDFEESPPRQAVVRLPLRARPLPGHGSQGRPDRVTIL